MGFIFAFFFFSWISKKQNQGLNPEMISDLVTYGAIGTLAGGRLGYCVFYAPDLFLKFKSQFPFWGVLAVNEGGMASHGGMIGLVLGISIFAYRHHLNRMYIIDLAALASPMGIFFGRIANFINGELVGRPSPENYALGVKFPQDMMNWVTYEPEKLSELADVVPLMPGYTKDQWLEWMTRFKFDGSVRDLVENAILKIIEQIQNGNQALKLALAPHLTARYPSQLYAALGEGLFIFIVLLVVWYKPRKTGVVGSTFVVLYAIVRIITESYRMPDAHLGYQWLNLTRGQWLSIVMLILGIAFIIYFSRRDAQKIPGWNRGQNVKLGRNR